MATHEAMRDEHYDLVSVLYHALQSSETIEQYLRDAEEAGDIALAEFFRELRDEDLSRVERAKVLLRERLVHTALGGFCGLPKE